MKISDVVRCNKSEVTFTLEEAGLILGTCETEVAGVRGIGCRHHDLSKPSYIITPAAFQSNMFHPIEKDHTASLCEEVHETIIINYKNEWKEYWNI